MNLMENGVLKVLGKDRTKETTCITTSNIKKITNTLMNASYLRT
ncbi:MAG TPA: hypothetical protein VJ916_00520 [Anaerovoracaceae bacterium]|nr:hypothetical protein [Anaerovoracaceae bacterium]